MSEYLDEEYLYGRTNTPPTGYVRTASALTKPEWTTITRPKYMSQYGLERMNKRILYQDQIWIDGNGAVWTINGENDYALKDDHLDRIIAWLEYGREWLTTYRAVSVVNSIMYRALVAERHVRVKKQGVKKSGGLYERITRRAAEIRQHRGRLDNPTQLALFIISYWNMDTTPETFLEEIRKRGWTVRPLTDTEIRTMATAEVKAEDGR